MDLIKKLHLSSPKTLLVICTLCTLLTGCTKESQAQQRHPVSDNELSVFSEECKILGKSNEYQLVSGKVHKAGIVPPKPSECLDGDCSWLSETWFFFVMDSLNPNRSGIIERFTVYTKPEQREELLKKEPYMKEQGRYAFCAKEMKESSQFHSGQRVYKVDFVETIKELN